MSDVGNTLHFPHLVVNVNEDFSINCHCIPLQDMDCIVHSSFSTEIDDSSFESSTDSIVGFCSSTIRHDVDTAVSRHFRIIIDTDISYHVNTFGPETFVTYTSVPNEFFNSSLGVEFPVLGFGTVEIELNKHNIVLENVLHVPSFQGFHFSTKGHASQANCYVDIDESGICLQFDDRFISLDDMEAIGFFSKIFYQVAPSFPALIEIIYLFQNRRSLALKICQSRILFFIPECLLQSSTSLLCRLL